MPWGDPRPARLLPAGALLTVVLLQIVRVWLPSLTLVPARGGGVSALALTALAGACLALPLLAVGLVPAVRSGRTLVVAGAVLVLARLVLQITAGGWPQLVAAGVGTIAGVLALAAWAVRVEGRPGRLAVLTGIVADAVMHLGLGTLDLVWRTGPAGTVATLLLALVTGIAVLGAGTTPPGTTHQGPGHGAAWPWLMIGPVLVLVLMVSAVPGRAALATGWSAATIAGVLAGAHALTVIAALAGPRLGVAPCGTVGTALVLLGTAGALRPVGALAVASQVALAVGIGLAVAALGHAPGRSDGRRTAVSVATAWLLVGLLAHGYQAWPQLPTPVDSRYLLVLAAGVLGVLALRGARRSTGVRPAGPSPRRVLAGAVTVATVALLTAGSTVLALPAPAPWPAPDEKDAVPLDAVEITVALLNVGSGYDDRGRFAPLTQADRLVALAPDLVVLNEADRGWLLTGGNDTVRLIADRVGREPLFAPTDAHLAGHALLTDLPLDDVHSLRLPRGPGSPGESLLSAVVELGEDHRLAVLASQLHGDRTQGDVRRRQARTVAAEVARLHGRGLEVVLLGDLQAEPRDSELEPLEEVLSHAVPAGVATWPAWQPHRQVDHVLVSPGVEVVSWDVVEAHVSDHLPVRVRLRVTTSEPADGG